MNVLQITEIQAFSFLLILARMSAFLVAWPLLGGINVPAPVKVLLALLLSLVFFPLLKDSMNLQVIGIAHLVGCVMKEVFVGLCLAFVSYLFFYAIQVGSELVATSMGVNAAQIYNPTMSVSMTPVDQFYSIMASLFFLLMNGHHIFLTGLLHSYDIIPATRWGLSLDSFSQIALIGKEVLIIGFQLSAPVLVSILLINISMAIIGRAVPQMNVLLTSMSVNVLVGIFILIFAIPLIWSEFHQSSEFFMEAFMGFLKTV